MRKTLSLKEDTYNKYIVKANLFFPIVEALKTNGSRYNILNSAIIELFDFIRLEDIKTLIYYIIESFYTDLESLDYVKTFKELKLKYDQYKDKEKLNDRSRISSEG
jgi:protein phosphatase 4 regulatory subunit 3